MILATLPWGLVVDRVGERWPLLLGLGTASAALLAASTIPSFAVLIVLLILAGGLGSVASPACGRAVMRAVPVKERGTALGVWQMAVPAGGALAAIALPMLSESRIGLSFLLLGGLSAFAGLCSGIFLRPDAAPREVLAGSAVTPLRERYIWLLAVGGALMTIGQFSFLTYLTILLTSLQGLSYSSAAAILALVLLIGALGLAGAGHLTNRRYRRVDLLRSGALVSGLGLAAFGVVVPGPNGIVILATVLIGVISVVSNGLIFAVASDIGGRERAATTVGLQTSVITASAVVGPLLFAGVVTAATWGIALLLSGGAVLLAAWVLKPLARGERSGWLAQLG
jgi:MFS family permease